MQQLNFVFSAENPEFIAGQRCTALACAAHRHPTGYTLGIRGPMDAPQLILARYGGGRTSRAAADTDFCDILELLAHQLHSSPENISVDTRSQLADVLALCGGEPRASTRARRLSVLALGSLAAHTGRNGNELQRSVFRKIVSLLPHPFGEPFYSQRYPRSIPLALCATSSGALTCLAACLSSLHLVLNENSSLAREPGIQDLLPTVISMSTLPPEMVQRPLESDYDTVSVVSTECGSVAIHRAAGVLAKVQQNALACLLALAKSQPKTFYQHWEHLIWTKREDNGKMGLLGIVSNPEVYPLKSREAAASCVFTMLSNSRQYIALANGSSTTSRTVSGGGVPSSFTSLSTKVASDVGLLHKGVYEALGRVRANPDSPTLSLNDVLRCALQLAKNCSYDKLTNGAENAQILVDATVDLLVYPDSKVQLYTTELVSSIWASSSVALDDFRGRRFTIVVCGKEKVVEGLQALITDTLKLAQTHGSQLISITKPCILKLFVAIARKQPEVAFKSIWKVGLESDVFGEFAIYRMGDGTGTHPNPPSPALIQAISAFLALIPEKIDEETEEVANFWTKIVDEIVLPLLSHRTTFIDGCDVVSSMTMHGFHQLDKPTQSRLISQVTRKLVDTEVDFRRTKLGENTICASLRASSILLPMYISLETEDSMREVKIVYKFASKALADISDKVTEVHSSALNSIASVFNGILNTILSNDKLDMGLLSKQLELSEVEYHDLNKQANKVFKSNKKYLCASMRTICAMICVYKKLALKDIEGKPAQTGLEFLEPMILDGLKSKFPKETWNACFALTNTVKCGLTLTMYDAFLNAMYKALTTTQNLKVKTNLLSTFEAVQKYNTKTLHIDTISEFFETHTDTLKTELD